MLKVYIDSGFGEVDYTKYVVGSSINIQKSLNVPTTCTMQMVNVDKAFKLPALRAYIRIFSSKYNRSFFTGLLTNDPSRTFVGLSNNVYSFADNQTGGQLFQYDFSFTSDEYLLNLKAVPFIPAFVNQSQGQILTTLAETLCPGYFDTSNVASGILVPYLVYDPTQSWAELAKTFGDASRYRYSCIDRRINFQPYGDGPLGVAYDEVQPQSTFDPFQLSTSALTTPVVNDITIIGIQEAGNNHEDYFIGDGFTGAFPLKHQVFNAGGQQGTTQGQSGSIVIADPWTENAPNIQTWNIQDPGNNFNYVDSALNIVTGIPLPYGESYIQAYNGLEIAGGLILQHGEFVFNSFSTGILGGVYDDATLNPATCETGYQVTPTTNVVVTASGASGMSITPFRLGGVPANCFDVITKINKTYVLTTQISCPSATRYTQVYTTMGGSVYGGEELVPEVQGTITWNVLESDIFTGFMTNYTFVMSGVMLPSFGIYGLINNKELNLDVNSTQVYTPPMGSLYISSEVGAGLLQAIYISGNVQFTGAYVSPSGGYLPIKPGLLGPEQTWPLGSSLQNQTAEIDLGTTISTLNFYSNDLPGVGVRIRLQSWESQAAVARAQDPTSIKKEADVVGDDGLRSAIVSNLSPMPRTSEDCDAACQAYLHDRVSPFYQGTYNASYLFFKQLTEDTEFFPTAGRYLYVNSPRRGIAQQNLLVSGITITVTEMAGEILTYQISFGPDLYLEKVLANFVSQPANTLLPTDTTVQLTPQQLAQIGSVYLPDITQSKLDLLAMTGTTVNLVLQDTLANGAVYEMRSADLNWGKNDSFLMARYGLNGTYKLARQGFEQLWYLRQVNLTTGADSRRSKVLRVYWPLVPSVPAYLYADSTTINCDFNGDIRNIEGIELRDGSGSTVYYEGIVGSEFDMMLNLLSLRGQQSTSASVIGGPVGQYMLGTVPALERNFTVYFFNLMWEYSPALKVYIPPPPAPEMEIGFRWGLQLQLNITPPNRTDINFTSVMLSNDAAFSASGTFYSAQTNGVPAAFSCTVPATGDIWAKSLFNDYISSGAWSEVVHVPQGDLIASDYLTGQGSVPPTIANSNTVSGGIFSYSTAASGALVFLDMFSAAFQVIFPNGYIANVPATSLIGATNTLDTGQPLAPSGLYGWFPALKQPATANEFIDMQGPYAQYSSANTLYALSGLYQDGSVPLTNGAFVTQTATLGPSGGAGTGGGGGGGSYGGGGYCGVVDSKLLWSNGTQHALKYSPIGTRVRNLAGRTSIIVRRVMMKKPTIGFETESGLTGKAAFTHVVYGCDGWKFLEELYALHDEEHEEVWVRSERKMKDKIIRWFDVGVEEEICMIELEAEHPETASDYDHIYLLDGVWAHNVVKSG